MSALTDRIAAEHQPESGEWSVCICGQADLRYGRAWDRHVAAVTEAAVREQVARDIEDRFAPVLAVAGVVRVAIRLCIAIVRGDAS